MRLDVSTHAIERFVERIVPIGQAISVDDARAVIAEAFTRAGRLSMKTRSGEQQWKCDDPRMVLVVKNDPGLTEIVTVIGPNEAPYLFPVEANPEESPAPPIPDPPEGQVTSILTLEITWLHKSGDRTAVEKLALDRVASHATGVAGMRIHGNRSRVISVRRLP